MIGRIFLLAILAAVDVLIIVQEIDAREEAKEAAARAEKHTVYVDAARKRQLEQFCLLQPRSCREFQK